MTVYNTLSDAIGLSRISFVESILKSNIDLDVMYNDCIFFKMVAKNQNVAITVLLFEYYENVQLAKLNKGSSEYEALQCFFRSELSNAIDSDSLPDKLKTLFSKYTDFDATSFASLTQANPIDVEEWCVNLSGDIAEAIHA